MGKARLGVAENCCIKDVQGFCLRYFLFETTSTFSYDASSFPVLPLYPSLPSLPSLPATPSSPAMPRRDANVHKALSRFMRGADTKTAPPIWYPCMVAYPPSPVPPLKLQHEKRQAYDLPKRVTPRQLLDKRPVKIEYPEDEIRKQFYRDHPFEAFRARSLVEMREVQDGGITGMEWIRLRQRGRNPTPEDCIQFTVNLHAVHNLALSEAYRTAVYQYRALRAEHTIMTAYAVDEAEAYGAEFGGGEVERQFVRETAALDTWAEPSELAIQAQNNANKKWHIDVPQVPRAWSWGVEYMQRLKRGGGPVMMEDFGEKAPRLVADARQKGEEDTFPGRRGRFEVPF